MMRAAARARVAVKPARTFARRCLVQARYVQDGRVVAGKTIDLHRSAEHHLKYIEREGVERDGSAGRLYDGREPSPSGAPDAAVREELRAPLAGEKHQFRFIVSPEDARELDMTEFVGELMRRVERDLGQPLIWGAVNHFDTAHPHAHVVVRGVDRKGREVRFDPEYIKRGFRARAEELVTEWLGPRTELEYQQQLERELDQQRYTTLDRGIAAKARDGVVRHEDLSELQRKRVAVLEALRLAERSQRGGWRLKSGWEWALRRAGERGDVIKQMHRAMTEVEPSRFVVCGASVPTNPIEGNLIHGRVVGKGLRDNAPDAMYAMIETARGSGYYVPLSPAQSERVREGDVVTLRRWTDRQGKERLSVDRSQLSLDQQVTYLGPTWLDSVQPSGTSTFALEVDHRRRARQAYLREQKLTGRDLRAVERKRLVDHYARKLGLTRAKQLAGFGGRVVEIHESPSGARYAIVASDREFVLLRATPQMRAWIGRSVRCSLADRDRDATSASKQKRGVQVEPIEQAR